jgi:hypothetical protein
MDFARQETTEDMPQLRVALLGQATKSAQVEARHDLSASSGLRRRAKGFKMLKQLRFRGVGTFNYLLTKNLKPLIIVSEV